MFKVVVIIGKMIMWHWIDYRILMTRMQKYVPYAFSLDVRIMYFSVTRAICDCVLVIFVVILT